MMNPGPSSADGPASRKAAPLARRYRDAARQPVACLAFLLPLAAAYELGVLLLRSEIGPQQRLVAQWLIERLIAWLGPEGAWVPGAALLVTLLLWQLWNKSSWRLRARVPLLMILESLLLALPLFVLGELLQQDARTGAGPPAVERLRVQLLLALGAGIFEELCFRFYLVGGLTHLLAGACRVSRRAAVPIAVVLASLIFAACHFEPVGLRAFEWPLFLVLTAAGGYLSVIFIARGLGIATGCHVAYNLVMLILSGT